MGFFFGFVDANDMEITYKCFCGEVGAHARACVYVEGGGGG